MSKLFVLIILSLSQHLYYNNCKMNTLLKLPTLVEFFSFNFSLNTKQIQQQDTVDTGHCLISGYLFFFFFTFSIYLLLTFFKKLSQSYMNSKSSFFSLQQSKSSVVLNQSATYAAEDEYIVIINSVSLSCQFTILWVKLGKQTHQLTSVSVYCSFTRSLFYE